MKKIRVEDMYQGRLEQIDIDLKKEYFKGKRKDKAKIAALLGEKGRLQGYLNGGVENN